MRCYKLTDKNYCTYGGMKWGEGVTHEIAVPDITQPLCTKYWLHAFIDPRLAVIFNPIYSNYSPPILWEAEAEGYIKYDGQSELGCTKLTTIKKIPLPKIPLKKIVEFANWCALKVYPDECFKYWAENWLDGNRGSVENPLTLAKGWAFWSAEKALQAAKEYEAMNDNEVKIEAAYAVQYAIYAKSIDLLSILDKCGI